MTKHELTITILQALLNVDPHKARYMADTKHGEYVSLMKSKKAYLEDMHEKAVRVLTKIK